MSCGNPFRDIHWLWSDARASSAYSSSTLSRFSIWAPKFSAAFSAFSDVILNVSDTAKSRMDNARNMFHPFFLKLNW